MKLEPLTPDRVYADWEWLRNGVTHCLQKTRQRYRQEDVYARLRTNSAWAYYIVDEDKRVGFTILTQEFDPDGLVLFVWFLWAKPFSLRGKEQALEEAFVDVARSIKARRIRMHSPRLGWERESFLTKVCSVFEHEVT